MSRCVSCNAILSTQEMSIKGFHSDKYLDLCKHCLTTTDIMYSFDPALTDNDAPMEFEENEDESTEE